MSEFKVKTQALRCAVNEEEEIQKRIYDIYEEVIQQKNSISFNICVKANIEWRLTRVSNGINKEYRSMQKMQRNLARVADLYEKTENTICKVVEDGKVTTWEKLVNIDWTSGLPKTFIKTLIDIIPQIGTLGGTTSGLATLIKILMDGDGISYKDIGALIKGTGTSLIKIFDAIKQYNDGEIDKLWGLNPCKTIVTDSQAGWLRATNTYGKTFLDKLNMFKTDSQTGATSIDGAKVGGWVLTFVADYFNNKEEAEKKGLTDLRRWEETVLETGIDIAKGAAISAAVAAGFAAIGVGAPVVVVAGAGVVVSAGLDFICKKITGAVIGEEKGLTETISDGILDFGEKVIGGITGAWASAKEAVCSWAPRFGYA